MKVTPSELQQLLAFSFANNFPTLITGKPGIGKTDIVKKAAKDAGVELIIAHPVVDDPTDYKGLPHASKGEADFLPYGNLRKLMKATKPTVFFFDDFGQASPAVQAACMQLLLAREINGNPVSDKIIFSAATNRAADKAGVSGILEPVKSRFMNICELEVSSDDWVRWALTDGGMPIELIAFIRYRPTMLDGWVPTKEIINSASPRTIAAAGKQQNAGIPTGLERIIFDGAAGDVFATEYTAFLKIFRDLPNIDNIFLNPDNVEVPTDLAVLYATCGAIAGRMTETNSINAFKYIQRLPVEMGVSCAKDTIARKPQITNTEGFIKWSVDKGNLLFN